jgi:tRNA threonylcarbamoyl adenosine modification protein YeaZ
MNVPAYTALAVETTSATGSLSLGKIGLKAEILASRSWLKRSTHSEVITLELSSALQEAKLELKDLTHLALDIGPGSFTGIRVGLNLVRSLSYALNIPVHLFCSLEVFAFLELKPHEKIIVNIQAVQNFVYAAAYERTESVLRPLSEPRSFDPKGLENLRTETKVERIFKPALEPNSETLLEMLAFGPNLTFVPWSSVLPLYIRQSEAEEKLRKGLLKPLF